MKPSDLILNRNAPGCHGLLGFWPIANGSSERSFDLINDVIYYRDSATAVDCTVGEELTHDGIWMPYVKWVSNAHSELAFNPVRDIGGAGSPFTILIWAYPSDTSNQRAIYDAGPTDPRFYFFANSGNLMIGLGNSFDSNMTNYVADKWQLFSVSYDGTNLWTAVDGLNEEAADFTGSKTLGSNTNLEIGDGSGSSIHWNSKMGPIAIYNRALRADEIRSIRNDFWRSFLGESLAYRVPPFWPGTGFLSGTLSLQSLLITDINGSAIVTADLRSNEPLATDINGSATISADLRSNKPLVADINGSATVTADIQILLKANLTGSALLVGNLSLPPLKADLTGSTVIVANVTPLPTQFIPFNGITSSATITAILETNLVKASNTITFTQQAEAFNELIGNTIPFTQQVDLELISNPTASDTIIFSDQVDLVNVFAQSISNVLDNLDHIAIGQRTLPIKTASSTISFNQNVTEFRSTQNTINFNQSAVGIIGGIYEPVNNTITFTQDVDVITIIELNLTSILQFSQEAIDNLDTNLTITSTLDFKQDLNNVVLNNIVNFGQPCQDYLGQPVYLQAPFNQIVQTVVLPAPLWGDTENITSEMSLMRSMNGTTRTYVKTNKNRRLTYTFRLLERSKAIELIDFLKSFNSDLIKLTNWKGEVWKVNLLNNPNDFVQTRRFGTDISLEFEGEKLYG